MIGTLISKLDGIMWGPLLIIACLGAGLLFSFVTKFVQVRRFRELVTCSFEGKAKGKKLSPFETLSIAIGGRVGTGNIVGTASAIFYGGPGAVFWMWVMCIVGTATAFAESVLSQIWKEKDSEEFYGGPPFYILKGLKSKPLAFFWATMCLFFTITFSGVQSSSFVSVAAYTTNINPIVWGLVFAIPLAILIVGGAKRIAKASSVIVPLMSFVYVAIAIIIVIVNISSLPTVIGMIFESAFNPKAVFGGAFGTVISWGIKRGIFSNEAGLGTAPLVAGRSETSHPAKTGLSQAFSVYIDTLVICSATAFSILLTNCYNVVGATGEMLIENVPGLEYSQFVSAAYESVFPGFGGILLTVALFLFNFTTVIAYPVYLGSIKHFLFGRDGNQKRAAIAMKLINIGVIVMAFMGSIVSIDILWNAASALSGMMSLVNIVCCVLLCKPVISVLKDYEAQKKKNLDPVFVPEDCGIKNAEVWHDIIEEDYPEELAVYKKSFK